MSMDSGSSVSGMTVLYPSLTLRMTFTHMAKTVTHVDNGETKPALFGEKDHMETAKSKTFTEMVFELLAEREASEAEIKLLDLIMNLSIDHGPNAPSAVATIDAAKEGKAMGESIGMGLSQINEKHGGAGEPLMELLYSINDKRLTINQAVEEFLKEGKRLPGLGHRVYKDKDPRAELIMETALKNGVGIEFVQMVRDLKEELKSQSGKDLPINIDGAIAAILCGFGLKPEVGIAVFIIARTPGLIGQYLNNS